MKQNAIENENLKKQISELEDEINTYHVPRVVRPIIKTALSSMPLIFSLGIHTTWQYISPETHSSAHATINHILGAGIFVVYNGVRAIRGEFNGLGRKYHEFMQAENKLDALNIEYENQKQEM